MFTRVPLLSLIIIGGSALALGGALFSQYVFGLHPCPLCIYQRYPYALLIVIGGVFAWRQWPWLLWVIMGLLVVEISIAFYHVGIEYHWWEGFTSCSASGEEVTSIEALRQQIMASPVVRCDEPAFVFILSMAGWNVVYALALLSAVVKLGLVDGDK